MAVFSNAAKGDSYLAPIGAARADLVDRNGQMLAADLLHYGLYIDPREIWDTAETRAALTAALPELTPERLDRALFDFASLAAGAGGAEAALDEAVGAAPVHFFAPSPLRT